MTYTCAVGTVLYVRGIVSKMPDLNVTINVPGLEKLLDYTASGVGAVAGPLLLPWKASWEAKARRITTRADADVLPSQAATEAETTEIIAAARAKAREYLVSPAADVQATVNISSEDITQRIEYQEQKRLLNVSSVVRDAANELGDKEVPDHEPDHDWTARFFDCVQDVTSEDMQKIWSRILAGEVESPGRTSLRTLDTLRNMTELDAETFRGVCDFVIGNRIVFYNESVKHFEALMYGKLLHLEECGLLTIGSNLAYHIDWQKPKYYFLDPDGMSLMIKSDSENNSAINIPAIRLTSAGHQLSTFAPRTLHTEYLRAFSEFLRSHNCDLYRLGNLKTSSGKFRYSNETRI